MQGTFVQSERWSVFPLALSHLREVWKMSKLIQGAVNMLYLTVSPPANSSSNRTSYITSASRSAVNTKNPHIRVNVWQWTLLGSTSSRAKKECLHRFSGYLFIDISIGHIEGLIKLWKWIKLQYSYASNTNLCPNTHICPNIYLYSKYKLDQVFLNLFKLHKIGC